MADVATLTIGLNADISAFLSGMTSAADAFNSVAEHADATAAAAAHVAASTTEAAHALDGLASGGHAAGDAVGGLNTHLADTAEHAGHAAEGIHGATSAIEGFIEAELIVEGIKMAFEKLSESASEVFTYMGEVQKVSAQTAAQLAATGGASNMTAEGIGHLAEEIKKHTGVSGEAIQSGENMLLMFKNVRDSVGAGNDIFTQATHSMVDMASAMGKDPVAAAKMLGKALDDPIGGVAALGKAGIKFTEDQKAMIASLVQGGDTLDAQKLILEAVKGKVEGVAEAYGKTLPGTMAISKMAWEDLGASIMGPILPYFLAWTTKSAEGINELAESIKKSGLAEAINEALGPKTEAAILGVAAALTTVLVPALFEAAAATEAALAVEAEGFAALGVVISGAATAAVTELLPLIAVTAAVGVAAYEVITHWDAVKEELVSLFDQLKGAAETATGDIGAAFGVLAGVAGAAVEGIGTAILAVGVPALAVWIACNLDAIAAGAAWAASMMFEAIPAMLAFATAVLEGGTAAMVEMLVAMDAAIVGGVIYTAGVIAMGAAMLGEAVPAMGAWILGLGTATAAGAVWAAELLGGVVMAIGTTAAIIVASAVPAVISFIGALGAFVVAAAPFIAVGAVIGAVAYEIYEHWDTVKTGLVAIWNGMIGAIKAVYNDFKAVWDAIASAVGPVADEIGLKFKSMAAPAITLFGEIKDSAGAALGTMESKAASTYESIKGSASGAWTSMQDYVKTFVGVASPEMAKFGEAAADTHDKAGKAAASAHDKAAKAILNTYQKLAADIASLNLSFDGSSLKDELGFMTKEVGLDETAMKNLREKGVNPLSAGFQTIANDAENCRKAIVTLKGDIADQVHEEKQAAILATLASKMEDITIKAGLFGESSKLNTERENAEATALQALLKLHGVAADVIQGVTDKMTAYQAKAWDVSDVTATLNEQLQKNIDRSIVLGDTFDKNKADAAAYAAALTTLADHHVTTGDAINKYTKGLNAANDAANAGKDACGNLGKQLDAVKKSMDGLATGIKAAAGVFGVTLTGPVAAAADSLGILFNATMQIASSVSTLVPSLMTLATTIGTAVVPALSAMGIASTLATGPLGWLVMAVGAVVTAGVALTVGLSKSTADAAAALAKMTAAARYEYAAQADFAEASSKRQQASALLAVGASSMNYAGNVQMAGVLQAQAAQLDNLGKSAQAYAATLEVASKLDAEAKAIGDSINSGMTSGLSSAIKGFLDGTATLTDGLRTGVKDAIMQGIITAIAQKGIIEGMLGGLFTNLSQDLAQGNMTDATSMISKIAGQIPAITAQLTNMLAPLQGALANAFNSTGDAIVKIQDKMHAALAAQQFTAGTLDVGTANGVGSQSDVSAKIKITQDALSSLNDAGAAGTEIFKGYQDQLAMFTKQLDALKAAGAGAGGSGGSVADPNAAAITAYQAQLAAEDVTLTNTTPGSADYNNALKEAQATQAQIKALQPHLAAGGLTTGPTQALIGEAGPEAVLPLRPSVFAEIAAGITAAIPTPAMMPMQPAAIAAAPIPMAGIASTQGGGKTVALTVQYFGNGKWTRDDVDQIGGLLVRKLATLGIRPS